MANPSSVRTTCPYCGVGCGVLIQQDTAGGIKVSGDPEHPANLGRLCSKGSALGETLDHQGRLLAPEVNGQVTDWDTALHHTAQQFARIIREHGPDAVAFYVSGQLLTEDYYVANKLMKGYLGSANIDTNSRLCMSSAVVAHKRAFGADAVPCCYEDLEQARLIVLTGSNTAWCHPVLYQRIAKAKKDNPQLKIVVIDPRRTATCDVADLHLALKPGSDHLLFSGLLAYLADNGKHNKEYTAKYTEGLKTALSTARAQTPDLQSVALQCELKQQEVETFFNCFAETEQTVTVFSQGMNQWSYGSDNGSSLINCHLLTGSIGRPGMGPFSFTGQPNAMGGREVGGLANQLAAHMAVDNPEHQQLVQEFWGSPTIATKEGLKAVDLFEAIHAGKVKALWVMATNPAVSLPHADRVREALTKCEFVAVSDCMRDTDTTRYAHVRLPALAWGEREGMVTNSERRISRQRAFLPAPGEAKPDWWIISQVAKRMGFVEAFTYENPVEIFREHARLSGHENNGQRDFDISACSDMDQADYDHFAPTQWPITTDAPQGTARLFGDGRFYTPSGKAQFIAVEAHVPANAPNEKYPLRLNTGRIRDQWHTMTRTGKSARLSGHRVEPFVDIHPLTAEYYGIREKELAQVSSPWGGVTVRARLTEEQKQNELFLPMHWNDQFASKSYADALTNPNTDPYSGQPEFKHTPVKIEPASMQWYGFLLTRRRLNLSQADYWACSRGKNIWRYEIAGQGVPEDWTQWSRDILCQSAKQVEWVEYYDQAQRRYRAARLEDGRLESCLFIGPSPTLPERDWLVALFDQETLANQDRETMLTGRPGVHQHDAGRVVCACFGVGINTLVDAIREQHLTTPEAIGDALRAGTNCGSCVPELREIIASTLGEATL